MLQFIGFWTIWSNFFETVFEAAIEPFVELYWQMEYDRAIAFVDCREAGIFI